MATFPFAVEKWRKWIDGANSLVDPFPTDLALKWIEMESGGNVCSVGRVDNYHVYEAGLAQTYFSSPSSTVLGVTSAELREKCDADNAMPQNLDDSDRSLQARVALYTMTDARQKSRNKLSQAGVAWPESSADFWAFVKLNHALPALQTLLAPCKRALGFEPTWLQFRAWVDTLSESELAAYNRGLAGRSGVFGRVWHNCEEFASVPGGSADNRFLWLLAAGAVLLYLHHKGAFRGLAS